VVASFRDIPSSPSTDQQDVHADGTTSFEMFDPVEHDPRTMPKW
jgi:hypothetical protein